MANSHIWVVEERIRKARYITSAKWLAIPSCEAVKLTRRMARRACAGYRDDWGDVAEYRIRKYVRAEDNSDGK